MKYMNTYTLNPLTEHALQKTVLFTVIAPPLWPIPWWCLNNISLLHIGICCHAGTDYVQAHCAAREFLLTLDIVSFKHPGLVPNTAPCVGVSPSEANLLLRIEVISHPSCDRATPFFMNC